MAGARLEPGLQSTADDDRVQIVTSGRRGSGLSPAKRAGIGAAALVGLILIVKLVAGAGGSGGGPTADKSLPAGTTTRKTAATTPAATHTHDRSHDAEGPRPPGDEDHDDSGQAHHKAKAKPKARRSACG